LIHNCVLVGGPLLGGYGSQKIMFAGNDKFLKVDGFIGLHYKS